MSSVFINISYWCVCQCGLCSCYFADKSTVWSLANCSVWLK